MPPSLALYAAVVDLTPRRPLPMGGYEGPPRLTRSTHGRLEANLLVLGEDDDAVVIVSLDTLFAGRDLTARIVEACAGRFGVSEDRVLVLASHTHFGPMLDNAKPRLGANDPDETARWADQVCAALLEVPRRNCGAVRTGLGRSDRAVNRRLTWRWPTLAKLVGRKHGDVHMCDSPGGPRDPRIRTCVWTSDDGEPLAAFWSFACHPVGFPEADTASADYVGVVREALRRELGAGLPVIFGPGCMGDVRPPTARPWLTLARAARVAAFGPSPLPFDRPTWDAWAEGLAREVVAADTSGETGPAASTAAVARLVRTPMADVFDGRSPTGELVAKAVTAPGVGRIVTLSCEPVADVAGLIDPSGIALVLGYEGDVFGYLPTDRMIAEGGYEPAESHGPFGLIGRFRPGLDATIRALGTRLSG